MPLIITKRNDPEMVVVIRPQGGRMVKLLPDDIRPQTNRQYRLLACGTWSFPLPGKEARDK